MKYIDLHTHTTYSDGTASPRELVMGAKLIGLDILAITDHDIIGGYKEAREEAENWGLILVPGIEFTERRYHILGLGFDIENKNLRDLIEKSKSLQRETTKKRVEILRDCGMPIDIEKIENYFPVSRLGKYNIFMSMLRDEECRKCLYEKYGNAAPDKIYCLYFKEGIAACVKDKRSLDSEEIIKTVHGARGIAILAHPPKDVDSTKEIGLLREQGIDGLEIQPNFYKSGYKKFERYARKNKMLITYGSDYHRANFDRPLLARGENKISPELEEILMKSVHSQSCFTNSQTHLAFSAL